MNHGTRAVWREYRHISHLLPYTPLTHTEFHTNFIWLNAFYYVTKFSTRKQRQVWSHHRFWKTNEGSFPHMSSASVAAGHMLQREEQTITWCKAPSISPCNSWGSRLYTISWMYTNGHLQSYFGYVCVTDSTHWSAGVRSSNVVLMVAFSESMHRNLDVMQNTFLIGVYKRMLTQAADVWKRAIIDLFISRKDCEPCCQCGWEV